LALFPNRIEKDLSLAALNIVSASLDLNPLTAQ